MASSLKLTDAPGRLVVELHRPEARNAIDRRMVDELHAVCRDLEDSPRTLILTGSDGVFASGADIARAVESVARGESVLGARISGQVLAAAVGSGRSAPQPFPQLTAREREVLELVARGYDNRRIARALFLSDKTVRNHVSSVLGKLEATDRSDAVLRARRAGMGRADEGQP